MAAKFIQYKCTWCGKTQTKSTMAGRPDPGRCPRKPGNKPHTWTINKRMD